MKKLPVILFGLGILLFLLLKATNLGIRLSDTNIYFYTAYQMLHGKILYKDIFFTNFPLLPYISAFYVLLIQGNLQLFYFTAPLETVMVSVFIFLIIKKEIQNTWLATFSALVYLFSFIVLSTSDHQTGVFLASLFAIISYWWQKKQRFFLSGIFMALALLTKAYFLPVFVAFLVVLWVKNKPKLLYFLLGNILAGLVVLLPSLILAPRGLFTDVFAYSLTRSVGLPKANIGWFFITHDAVFFLLLLFSLIFIRKQLFSGVLSLSGIVFFFLYKDVYYLYLNFLPPFLCLLLPDAILELKKRGVQQFVIPTCLILFLSSTFVLYITSYRTLGTVSEISHITREIKMLRPQTLYGTNDIAPALSYFTGIPLLKGIIDTNENIFNKGYLNATSLSKQAIAKHSIIIAHGSNYPGIINDPLLDTIFDKAKIQKSCQLIHTYPVYAEGSTNEIVLYECGKK